MTPVIFFFLENKLKQKLLACFEKILAQSDFQSKSKSGQINNYNKQRGSVMCDCT